MINEVLLKQKHMNVGIFDQRTFPHMAAGAFIGRPEKKKKRQEDLFHYPIRILGKTSIGKEECAGLRLRGLVRKKNFNFGNGTRETGEA